MSAILRYRRVRQEAHTSCGIACVATVARTTHRTVLTEARRLFDWGKETRSFYTSFSDLKELLAAFNLRAGRKNLTNNWSKVPALAVAAINFRIKDDVEYWHWVVVQRIDDGIVVLDPRSTREQRTDTGRMRLHAYIPIRPNIGKARPGDARS